MSGKEIGFGVVGLGMGRHHCKALATARGARLVAVCDIDTERLEAAADEFGVAAYESYEEMLGNPEVEAVCIAVPSGLHVDLAMQALAAEKHLLIEKPVDIDLEKIRRLREAVDQSGCTAAVVFQSRTTPLNKRIHETVKAGKLGRLIGIHAILPWYRKDKYFQGPHGSWKGTWSMDGGGSLMNQGVHTVDLLQWVGGRIRSVVGAFDVFNHDIEAEDKTVAILKFENGALGTLATTTCAFPGLSRIFLLHGSRGTIHTEGHLLTWKLMEDDTGDEEREMLGFYGPKELQPEGQTVASDPMAVGSTGHVFHLEDLVDSIRDGRDPYVTVASATHAVEIINAIYESGRLGREVEIPSP